MAGIAVLTVGLAGVGCQTPAPRIPPTPLTELEGPTLTIEPVWRGVAGEGLSIAFRSLQPELRGERLYTVSPAGELRAYRGSNGNLLWRESLGTRISGGLAAGPDGLLYAGGREGVVVAFDPEARRIRWRQSVSSEVLAAPAVTGDRLIVRTLDGAVRALDRASGQPQWVYHGRVPGLTLRGISAPTPVLEGRLIVLGFDDGRLVGLRGRDGEVLWEVSVALPQGRNELERMVDIDARPLVDTGQGRVFVAAYQSGIVAIELRGGSKIWTQEISTYQDMARDDDRLYAVAEDGIVAAIDQRTGSIMWQQDKLRGRQLTAPTPQSDYLVVADRAGYVHWLRRRDGRLVGRTRIPRALVSGTGDPIDQIRSRGFTQERVAIPPLVDGDRVYVVDRAGRLAAFRVRVGQALSDRTTAPQN